MITIPPYLKEGDTIGIVCPSGYMPAAKVETCIETLRKWGYKVKTGATVGSQFHYFSGTDEQRLADLQNMMDDDSIHAILCGRGGYGLSRIVDKISFKKFVKKPKWIIGYSDVTMLHLYQLHLYNIASIHSPMAAAFNDGESDNEYIKSLRHMLAGQKPSYTCKPHELNREGIASGILVGGNLSLICHNCGTCSELRMTKSILFIEDVGEYIYNIDRMFQQLKRSSKFKNLAGLVIGSFSDMKDTTIPFGKNVEEVIADAVKEFDFPVCFQFPVGHTNENYALKLGVMYELNVGESRVILKEQ